MAFLTWKTIGQISKQGVFLQKQTRFLVAASDPLLKVEHFSITGNSVRCKVKNIGSGTAFQIGIGAAFIPAEKVVKSVDYSKGIELVHFNYDSRPLIDSSSSNTPIVYNGYVTFLSANQPRPFVLRRDESIEFDIMPKFAIRFKTAADGTAGRTLDLAELKELFASNGRDFFSLELSLYCKNAIDEPQAPLRLANFIFDVNHHVDLQSWLRSKMVASISALSTDEVETVLGGQLLDVYLGMKSGRNYVPGESDYDWLNQFK